jgi:hypothetical protein
VEITNELLEKLIADEAVGGSKNAIKGQIKDVIHDLEQSKKIAIENEDSYGSGYASYVDVFCFKKDGSSSRVEGLITTTHGIALYLCKLASVAVMGAMTKTRSKNGGSSSFLRPDDLNKLPPGDWDAVIFEIKHKLEKQNFVLLEPKILKQTMPFEATIPTILGDPPYQIFDAFFHWED